MTEKNAAFLLAKVEMLEREIQDLRHLLELWQADKQWYTTAEAAALLDITQKTAANYCQTRFERVKKQDGRWYIHRSELT